MKIKFLKQKGMSIAEVLVALVIATTVMGASYMIYNNFQGTFVRQIGHNNIKQEARFALHTLQFDSRMAGYKHPDSSDGEVQNPVIVLNDDGTEVADSTEFGEVVKFCYDTEYLDTSTDPATPRIQRKLIRYELKIPHSPLTEKTVLKKKVWNNSNCEEVDDDVALDWTPVAQFFSKFAVRIRSKHIDYEINMTSKDEKITEKYSASSFMRNLNYGGNTYYARDEDDLHNGRLAVLAFTGSMKATCANDIKRDIQLAQFTTDDDIIELHQGELVGTDNEYRTHERIIIRAEKPPEITGIPKIQHSQMKLRLTKTSGLAHALPPGLTASSGFIDEDNDGVKDDTELYDGTLIIEGDLNNADSNYSFDSDGYQEFPFTVEADLDVDCDSDGTFDDQSVAKKSYTIRVKKYEAPQLSDINMHEWSGKGITQDKGNYESRGNSTANGGPFYDVTADGKSFYVQQNLSSPSFYVSNEEYTDVVVKGMICQGSYPDCVNPMTTWMDDDLIGMAFGYTRPATALKVWPDGRIRACAGVDYLNIKDDTNFSETRLKNSLRSNERSSFTSDKENFFGPVADKVFDMYLWHWFGHWGTNSSGHAVSHFNNVEFTHEKGCGFSDSGAAYPETGPTIWSRGTSSPVTYYAKGYDHLYANMSETRPSGSRNKRNCYKSGSWSNTNGEYSFGTLSYAPGAYHTSRARGCFRKGADTGIKNLITALYRSNNLRVNIENKPFRVNTDNIRYTAFNLKFDDGVLKDYNKVNPSNISLPTTQDCTETTTTNCAKPELKEDNFKKFQGGSIAIFTQSQPDVKYSNFQIAKLPRWIPKSNASNKPMPKANNLYFYMNSTYNAINKVSGLLSKSYDPNGEPLNVVVDAATCETVGGRGTATSGALKTQSVDGSSVSVDCRLSGAWRAQTMEWEKPNNLPNINEVYDMNGKSSYSGARATVDTAQGGEMYVYTDGSFKYKTVPSAFSGDTAGTDSFYYAVQTDDITNARISDIKKVTIGYNIANTTPNGLTFKSEDGSSVLSEDNDLNFNEDSQKNFVIAKLEVTTTGDNAQEPDPSDFVRFNIGKLESDDPDIAVKHSNRFRIDQIDKDFYLILNRDDDNRWSDLPQDKKFFKVRIIATDLRGNQYNKDAKVKVNRVDCSETGMENIVVYKTKAAMTISGFIKATSDTKVFRRKTVPLTSGDDEAIIKFNFPERNIIPQVRITDDGMLSNRCKEGDNYPFIDRQQLWSNS